MVIFLVLMWLKFKKDCEYFLFLALVYSIPQHFPAINPIFCTDEVFRGDSSSASS